MILGPTKCWNWHLSDSIWACVMQWSPLICSSKEVKTNVKNHLHYSLASVCSPQTNRKPWRVWRGRSSCHCIPKNLQWDKVPEPQPRLARGDPEPGRCHTAGFVCVFTVQQKCAIPLMPFPWFHLPRAKRADTMKVYSRKLIKSSCILLHMAASQPPIYKEYKEKNVKKKIKKYSEQCTAIINRVENVIDTVI